MLILFDAYSILLIRCNDDEILQNILFKSSIAGLLLRVHSTKLQYSMDGLMVRQPGKIIVLCLLKQLLTAYNKCKYC